MNQLIAETIFAVNFLSGDRWLIFKRKNLSIITILIAKNRGKNNSLIYHKKLLEEFLSLERSLLFNLRLNLTNILVMLNLSLAHLKVISSN